MFALAKIGAVHVPINTRFRTVDLAQVLARSNAATLMTHDVSGPVDYLGMVRELASFDGGGESRRVRSARPPDLERVVVVLSDRQYPGAWAWPELVASAATVDPARLAARAAAVRSQRHGVHHVHVGNDRVPSKGVMRDHTLLRPHGRPLPAPAVHPSGTSSSTTFRSFTSSATSTGRSARCWSATGRFSRRRSTPTRRSISSSAKARLRSRRLRHAPPAPHRRPGSAAAQPVDVAHRHHGGRRGERDADRLSRAQGAGAAATPDRLRHDGSRRDDLDVAPRFDGRAGVRSVGLPCEGFEVRVIDPDTGHEQPRGTPGEIVVRTRYLMQGYYRDPERPRAPSMPTAGSTRATPASCAPTHISASSAATRT